MVEEKLSGVNKAIQSNFSFQNTQSLTFVKIIIFLLKKTKIFKRKIQALAVL